MQPHPLEIPEILALVGSYLSLWVDAKPHELEYNNLKYKPKTFCYCLRVSKLWYRTLLPIFWRGFWADYTMQRVPVAAVRRHCHLLRILHLGSFSHPKFNLTHFENATNLTNLTICVGGDGLKMRQRSRGWRGGNSKKLVERRVPAPLLSAQRFLLLNSGLRTLHWEGHSCPIPTLDAEAFIELKSLENLSLENWVVSGGRLEQVLRTVAGSLKSLSIGKLRGIQPDDLSSSSPQGDDDYCDSDSGNVKAQDGLRLGRLESLRWRCDRTPIGYLPKLVKCFPNLKAFTFTKPMNHNECDVALLADSLRVNCPCLKTLIFPSFYPMNVVETLVRHCSASGLQELALCTDGPETYAGSVVSHHAGILEDLFVWHGQDRLHVSQYLPLLATCTRLTRLVFHSTYMQPGSGVLHTLKQKRWGCHNLQVLELRLGFIQRHREQTQADREEMASILSLVGWMKPFAGKKEALLIDARRLREVFRLVEYQELNMLHTLVLDNIKFLQIPQKRQS